MPTLVAPHVPLIDPKSLDIKTQQELWTGIKALDPTLADLIKHDPNVSELKNTFGATIRFTQQNLNRYVAEGRRLLEGKRNATTTHRA